MKSVVFVASVLLVACEVFAAEDIGTTVHTFHADFTGKNPPARLNADFPIKLDLTQATGVAFDFSCEDLQTFSHFSLYFKSGNGWYSAYFTPKIEGRVEHAKLPMREIKYVEGEPAGLDKITCVRFSAWNGAPNKCVVTFGKLRVLDATDAEVLVLCADSCNKSGKPETKSEFSECAGNVVATIDALGIPVSQVSDLSLSSKRLEGVRLVVLPFNPTVPDMTKKILADWVAAGGKLLVCFEMPEPFGAVTGVNAKGPLYVGGRDGQPELGGFLRTDKGLRFQPVFSGQGSHCCNRVELSAGATVVAEWSDRKTGASTGLPAAVKTPNAVFLSHVWYGGTIREPLEMMRSILASLVPDWERRFADELAKKESHKRAIVEKVRQMPSRPGERRLAWCHSPWGLEGTNDWDSSVKFLKDSGFTDIVDNLAWGGTAYYNSKVLARAMDAGARDALDECLSACRKHGIRLHVWKVCWNPGDKLPTELYERYAKEGRLQVCKRGKSSEAWFCPSDPRNQQQEIDAMCELADRGVDGIHFDYIRYPGYDCCHCNGCRARFEKFIGRGVANWPSDVDTDETLTERWVDFRAENISTVVRAVAKRVRKAHPKTEISAAVMRNAPQDRITLGQDWGLWCREGWLDFACPMDYTESPALFRGNIRRQKTQVAGAKLYPGIGLSCWQENGDDVERFVNQLEILREEGVEGFIVFNFDRRFETALPIFRKGPFAK